MADIASDKGELDFFKPLGRGLLKIFDNGVEDGFRVGLNGGAVEGAQGE